MLLDITTTIGCANNCSYCPQDRIVNAYYSLDKNNPRYLKYSVFKRCLSNVSSKVKVAFAGFSEPFLNPGCVKMIDYAYNKGHPVCLYSTLVGLNLSDLSFLIKNVKFKPINKTAFPINIHLPSAGNLENIKVTDQYIKLVEKLKESDIDVDWHYHGNSIHQKLKKIFKTKTCKQVPFHTRAGNVEILKKIPKRKGRIMCGWAVKKNGKYSMDSHVLLPDGTVVICCMDYGLENILGNLLDSKFEDLHDNDVYQRVMSGLKSEPSEIICRYCDRTINLDYKAEFYNSNVSWNKLSAGAKLIYNHFKNFIKQ